MEPAAHAPGTSVEVVDIYFNTPARRKFLKSENTEYAHCEAVFERIALAHPHVEFMLRHNGKVIWRLPAQSLAERVAAMLGKDFVAAAIEIDTAAGPLTLSGFVASPLTPRPAATPSTSTSTAASCATRPRCTRCARPIGTYCTTIAIRPTRCS